MDIKELILFLPYGLKVSSKYSIKSNHEMEFKDMENVLKGDLKPLLRPLSDLNKTEFNFMFTYTGTYYENGYFHTDSKVTNDIEHLEFRDFKELLTYNFDIFGWIDKGLANNYNLVK